MERVRMSVAKKAVSRNKNVKKRSFSLFAAQCVVSVLLIVFGLLINYSKSKKYDNIRATFSAVVNKDGGLEKVSDALSTFVKKKEPSVKTEQQLPVEESGVTNVAQTMSEVSEVIKLAERDESNPQNVLDDNVNLPVVLMNPLDGKITSPFGYRLHPTLGQESFHYGIDIAAPKDTPIAASADGTVTVVDYSKYYGNFLVIKHDDLTYTFYGHCNSIAVSVGDSVKRGDCVAYVGTTGVSTGNHLHFEVRYNNNYLNPLKNIIR